MNSMRRIKRFLLVLFLALFVGCSVNPVPEDDPVMEIVIDDSLTTLREGRTFAPRSVIRIAWKKQSGKTLLCDFFLYREGEPVDTRHAVEGVVFSVEEEGHYRVELTPAGVRSAPVSYSFSVTRAYEELYQSPGGSIKAEFLDALLAVSTLDIHFFRYAEEPLPGTSETIQRRDAMNLKDSNQDGVYDHWEIIPNAFAQGVSVACAFNTLDTDWHLRGMRYEETAIYPLYFGIAGLYQGYYLHTTLATVGFEIGVPFARYLHDAQGSINDYASFTLRERYNTDRKPCFFLDLKGGAPSREAEFTLAISAPNAAEFAAYYDTRYFQMTVAYDPRLSLNAVSFPNFLRDQKELTGYRVNTEGSAVTLYRGVVVGEDEKAAISPDFALLTFRVKAGAPLEYADFSLVYESDLDAYANYPDNPNPAFKNKSNGFVDGLIVEHAPLRISFGNGGGERR